MQIPNKNTILNKNIVPNKMDTSCKECLWADYDNDGLTQVECQIGMIDKFRQKVEILEAYDAEKEFYVIRKRKCMWRRTKGWKHAKGSFSDRLFYIGQEIEIKYQAIIFANNSLKDCKKTVQSLLNQTVPPKHITIIKPTITDILPNQYIELVNNKGIGWRVENIVNPSTPKGSMIDFVIDVKPHPYYAVFNAGFEMPPYIFHDLNNQVNENLYQLSILTPNKDDNGLVVSWHVHKIYQGHQNTGLIEKIKQDGHKLTSITELCPNFPK